MTKIPEIVYAKQTMKDGKKHAASDLEPNAEELLAVRILLMWTHYEWKRQ